MMKCSIDTFNKYPFIRNYKMTIYFVTHQQTISSLLRPPPMKNEQLLLCSFICIFSDYLSKMMLNLSKNIHIFEMSNIFACGRELLPIDDRHFLCPVSIRRFRTPVWNVNAPTAASTVLDNGKDGTAFSFPSKLIFNYLLL